MKRSFIRSALGILAMAGLVLSSFFATSAPAEAADRNYDYYSLCRDVNVVPFKPTTIYQGAEITKDRRGVVCKATFLPSNRAFGWPKKYDHFYTWDALCKAAYRGGVSHVDKKTGYLVCKR